MNRAETLDAAKACVCQNREQEYGSPEDNFRMIANLWSHYCGYPFEPADVANMMILLKVARNKSGHSKADNWIDIAGYAACGAELQG